MSPPAQDDPGAPGPPPAGSERRRTLVVAALVRDGDRVLLSQRRADQALPLCWELPGGKVEPGEAPEAALRREIHEELGCQVAVGPVFDVVFHRYPDFDLLMLVYVCTITEGTPTARQVAAVAWVPARDLLSLDLPPADLPLARRLTTEARRTTEGHGGRE